MSNAICSNESATTTTATATTPKAAIVGVKKATTAGKQDDEDDAFWNIALMQHDRCSSRPDFSDGCNHSEEDDEGDSGNRVISYRLPIVVSADYVHRQQRPYYSAPTLHLSPLPSSQGIWSPLGAEAWYGSALLSAYLLQQIHHSPPLGDAGAGDNDETHRRDCSSASGSNNNKTCHWRIQEHLAKFDKSKCITALELGSGAVGLAGLSLASMLAIMSATQGDCPRHNNNQQQNHRVILTDNEASIVQQLNRNVVTNESHLQQQLRTCVKEENQCKVWLPHIYVETLDWKDLVAQGSGHPLITLLERRDDYNNDNNDHEGHEGSTDETKKPPCSNHSDGSDHGALQLLIGSELVYTPETARACAASVTWLLDRYPRLLVLIIQVIHRDGWSNVFLPLLRRQKDLVVVEESIPVECDAMARDMIQAGGTLDRFDFGACYVYRSK